MARLVQSLFSATFSGNLSSSKIIYHTVGEKCFSMWVTLCRDDVTSLGLASEIDETRLPGQSPTAYPTIFGSQGFTDPLSVLQHYAPVVAPSFRTCGEIKEHSRPHLVIFQSSIRSDSRGEARDTLGDVTHITLSCANVALGTGTRLRKTHHWATI